MRSIAFALCLLSASAGPCLAQRTARAAPDVAAAAPAPPSLEEQEQFLLDAKITKVRGAKKGITGTQRATLSNGTLTHDASIQTIDQSEARFQSATRVELNFRDYWGYNVAAYKLAVTLGLDMVPASVKRGFRGADGSFTWWIDDVIMDEQERAKKKQSPPNPLYWNSQVYTMRVFDELISNTDRNQGNMLLDRGWKLWLIDHSRAFRTNPKLRAPEKLLHCERKMLAQMRRLTRDGLKAELGDYLTSLEIDALLERRDRIVERIEGLGPKALFDLRPPKT
jgi:hypothetical protein